jgi:hypothetical protein
MSDGGCERKCVGGRTLAVTVDIFLFGGGVVVVLLPGVESVSSFRRAAQDGQLRRRGRGVAATYLRSAATPTRRWRRRRQQRRAMGTTTAVCEKEINLSRKWSQVMVESFILIYLHLAISVAD